MASFIEVGPFASFTKHRSLMVDQLSPGPNTTIADTEGLKGWLPVDAVVHQGRPGLVWMEVGDTQLSEPFFHQTVEKLRARTPAPREKFAEFDQLIALEKSIESLKPSGFIFHSSRCGSTVISNALRCVDGAIVLSEPEPVDKLLMRFITDANDNTRELLYSVFLRSLIAALGQKRREEERRLFIKFSCCSVVQLERIRRIWPDVPWLFIYREPVETIVSNLRTVPQWLLDEDLRILAGIIDVSTDDIDAMPREELCARAIGKFYESALRLADDRSMLLNYAELSQQKILQVLEFFKIAPTAEEITAIRDVSQLYSKDVAAERQFVDDRQQKRSAASQSVTDMAAAWSSSSYQQLETLQKKVTFAWPK